MLESGMKGIHTDSQKKWEKRGLATAMFAFGLAAMLIMVSVDSTSPVNIVSFTFSAFSGVFAALVWLGKL